MKYFVSSATNSSKIAKMHIEIKIVLKAEIVIAEITSFL